MTKLIPQDYQQTNDNKGSRKKTTPQDLASGTYFGQMQLRGSILVIKDNSTTASGFISYGTSMSTIPTTSASGTGVYQDYSGIYGNLSGVPQFYLQASDGKAYAGAGTVTLDVNGITIVKGTSSEKALKWADSVNGQRMFELYGDDDGTFQQGYISGLGTSNITSGEMIVRAKDYVGDRELTFKLFADTPNTRTYANLIGTSTFVGFLISGTEGVPSSLLHLKSTAPTFRMEDSTASAKSLLVTVDANLATFGEVTGGTFFTLDLANKDVKLDGDLLFTDATYDIGASGATRPRHLYLSGNAVIGGTITGTTTGNAPVGSAFVTIGTDATLTSERALTGTSNQITVTDNGAGSTVVLSTPQSIATTSNVTFNNITANGAFTSLGIDDNADAMALTIDSSERVIFGHTAVIQPGADGITPKFQVWGSSTANGLRAGMAIGQFSADTRAPYLMLGKSRGASIGSYSAVQADDVLGIINWFADDGTDIVNDGARIQAVIDGTVGTNDIPTRLEFYVTADGAVVSTLALRIANDKSALFKNSIKSDHATAGIGYATGAGGTVTQATNKATGVTLSKVCGAITMNNAALAGDTTVSFTLTNTAIAATDVLTLNHISGGTIGSYLLNAQCAAGSATINVRNITTGSLSEAIVIQFAVIKGVNA